MRFLVDVCEVVVVFRFLGVCGFFEGDGNFGDVFCFVVWLRGSFVFFSWWWVFWVSFVLLDGWMELFI